MSESPFRSRSTPIPGSSTIIGSDPAIPGNPGSMPPPTPQQFVAGATATAPPAPPPGGPRQPLPGMYPHGDADDFTFEPLSRRHRRRGIGWVFLVLVISAGPIAGVAVGIWAFLKARDAVDQASELSDPNLSDRDRRALGLADGIETLFEADAPAKLAAAFDAAIPGEPTGFSDLTIYRDYAFATAQDPAVPAHVDRYTWRLAEVGTPDPQTNLTDPSVQLFTIADVDWAALAALASAAPRLTEVEGGAISHITIDRTVFRPEQLGVVRIYVSGARGNGFIEATLSGEVLAVH